MNMQEVATQLQLLEQANGRLHPDDVVEAARPESSPMHPFFEWDDSEAARLHRQGQARQLIRRIKIEVVVRDVPMDVVRYVRDPQNGGAYRAIVAVRSEEDAARRVVADEMQRVIKAARRAKAVAALLGSQADVEEIVRIAGQVAERAQITDQPAGAA